MIRLPKEVADAKAEFEKANNIKDAINNPRQILKESKLNTMFEYPNPTVATLCQKKLLEYNSLAVIVRTKILAGTPIATKVAKDAALVLGTYSKGLAKFPETNDSLVVIGSGDLNKYNSHIPECLKSSSVISNILSDISKELKSLFQGDFAAFSIIDEVISSLKSKIKSASEAIEGGFDVVASKVKEVMKCFEDSFKLVQNEVQRALFIVFDAINDFITSTGIGKDIAKLREYDNCLRSHCRPTLDYMVNMDDVMPNMMVNLPIDQYTGEFRVYKLKMYSDSYPELNTPEGSRVLHEMDSDYNAYKAMRDNKIKELAKSVGSKIDIGRFL